MSFLTRLSLKKRWLTFLVAAVVTLGSIYAVLQLKMEMIPDIELPVISVATVYPGASQEQVVTEVTMPVEGAISGTEGLREIRSTSASNLSFVFAQFEFGTDMKKVATLVSRNLAALELPPGVRPPELFPLDLSMFPVVMLALSGDATTTELRSLATTQVLPRLQAVEGVFRVEVMGGEEQAIVAVDPGEMNRRGIPTSQVAALLGSRQYSSLAEIEDLPLGVPGEPGVPQLRAIARVALGPAPGTAITRTNGRPSVMITVMKDAEANTVSVANGVAAEAARLNGTLPQGAQLAVAFDQSEFIERSISQLVREAGVGALLAVGVILLFLMAFRVSLVTALSIPLSVFIGFLLMWVWGLTVNLFTLGAMGIAVGRVVDDSIVSLEVIFRHMKRGDGFREAALKGAREIATPITSATIATVAVFIPLAFLGGMAGELFRPFALTVTFALLASLLVALMVVPALSSVALPRGAAKVEEPWYQRAYVPALRWALGHRALTLGAIAALTLGSFALLPFIGTTFLPTTTQKLVTAEVKMPLGTGLGATAQRAVQVEEVIRENLPWRIYNTTVGTSSMFGGLASLFMGGGSDTASIMVELEPDADMEAEAQRLRRLLQPLAGEGQITVSSGMEQQAQMAGMAPGSLEITVIGPDSQSVGATVTGLTRALADIDGLANIQSDLAQVIPQPRLQPDPAAMARHGLDPEQMGKELALLMRGAAVSELTLNGQTYPVFLAPPLAAVRSPQDLRGLLVGGGRPVALGEIATVDLTPQPTHILRVDEKPAARVTAGITEKDVGAVNQQVEARLAALDLAPGVGIKQGGVFEEMTRGFRQMGIAILMAIGISYLVLVVTFRSFLTPFTLMFSLPVAAIGALLALFLTGRPMGMPALMGMLMLVGIVLTNAIVLIALVEQLRKAGMSTHDALVAGGSTRLRPILMTAVATMFALFPLSLGLEEGTLITAELATVVIGGLFTSTALTLLVVPVVYSLLEGLRRRAPRG